MILHRRIHKFRKESFDEGVQLAKQLNDISTTKLGRGGTLYAPSMLGSALSRRHLVIDTVHENLAAMEQHFQSFLALDEVRPLLGRWNEVEEETWAENYRIIHP